MMTSLAPRFARAVAALTLVLGAAPVGGCTKVTTIASDSPIQVQAQPPAPPLADLPAVPQPPPPSRVELEGDVLTLDEALTFDEAGTLAAEHADIVAELAKWLSQNPDTVLTVEASSIGKGSKRTHAKLSAALATQIVDALVGQGVDAERLVASGVGASPDELRHVVLRVAKPNEEPDDGASVGFEIEE